MGQVHFLGKETHGGKTGRQRSLSRDQIEQI